MNPIRIPIGNMTKDEFVESICRFFPHVEPILAERMYNETKEYYINIIYDLNTGEILQAQGGNGWILHASYIRNIPTPENFDTFEGSVKASCDFDAMQNSQAFINDLLMNARRVLVYNEGEFESFHLIQLIHSRVDEILGITHLAAK